nr:xanthine dehydrogenase family protein subunit M [uncultured Lichenicoccus sp.]
MRPFSYSRADSLPVAIEFAHLSPSSSPANAAPAQFVAGGTNILDLMKLDVMRPETLIDISGLAAHYGKVEVDAKGLRLGAFAHMSEAADNAKIIREYPVVAESLKLAASAQLRNMATLGGNVLQRTRCPYFRDVAWSQCNKRGSGGGCAALEGSNRKHAVLGTSEKCISAYPGDFAQALVALGASVHTVGPGGSRVFPFEQLFLSAETPERETVLAPGEVIISFFVPAGGWTRRSTYVKIRDRQSYEFALASAAVALELDGDVVREARVALGGVAYKPWRAREAEAVLKGRQLDDRVAREAARAAFADARTRDQNGYKVALGQRTLIRALRQARTMDVS